MWTILDEVRITLKCKEESTLRLSDNMNKFPISATTTEPKLSL
jgi:hypothetical protein